ncbi:MAG: ATP-binding protein [Calditerrivibrio sp.]|nr:ATP-binding protein [Calditerrivibrio sp.]
MDIEKTINEIEQILGMNVSHKRESYSLVNNYQEAEQVIKSCILHINNISADDYVENKNYSKCFDYMINTNGLGLALFGDYGTGKTDFIKVILNYLFYVKYKKIIFFIDTKRINDEIYEKIIMKQSALICLDDVGSENDYKITNKYIPAIIDHIYSTKCILYLTSNKSRTQFEQLYGKPVVDRILGICQVIEFEGESFRTKNKKKKLV